MSNDSLHAVAAALEARRRTPSALTDDELARRLRELQDAAAAGEQDEAGLWSTVLAQLLEAWRLDRKAAEGKALGPDSLGRIIDLYGALRRSAVHRGPLLALLAKAADAQSLAALAELAATDPPREPREVAVAVAPLFQLSRYDPRPLFPRLLDALAEPAWAAAVLDLANFLTSQGRLPAHPAAERATALAELLGQVVQRLALVGESGPRTVAPPGRGQVAELLALAVSLLNTARLLADPRFVGKLYQALDLPHRRLRAEAAVALATLGERAGLDALEQLAREPVVREAALAHLEQLGAVDGVDPALLAPEARAEGRLAAWLAEPTQFGFPPTELELLDRRRLFWPGYERSVDCFLFRYVYRLPGGELAGVGLAGPVTWAFAIDAALWTTEDLYALFAGWHAAHEEISESAVEVQDREALEPIAAALVALGYRGLQPIRIGQFFGAQHLVAEAVREGQAGTVVVDLGTLADRPAAAAAWYPRGTSGRFGPTEAYWLHKGRLLLETFNPAAGEGA
jgi:hypothetical protein